MVKTANICQDEAVLMDGWMDGWICLYACHEESVKDTICFKMKVDQ